MNRVLFDRRRAFFIEIAWDAPSQVFFAKKSFRVCVCGRSGDIRGEVFTAAAVRERGTEKRSVLIGFPYCCTSFVTDAIEGWIAMQRSNSNDKILMFSTFADPPQCRVLAKSEVRKRCLVLLIAQRCADLFILWHFRVTRTMAGKILLCNELVLNHVRLATKTPQRKTTEQVLRELTLSWFLTSCFTEYQMRGSSNESVLLHCLASRPFVSSLFKCGMLALSSDPWITSSPDTISWITPQTTDLSDNAIKALCLVEVMTSVATSSLSVFLTSSFQDVIMCTVGDETFVTAVPLIQCVQLLQKAIFLGVDYVIYVTSSETVILFICVVKVPPSMQFLCHGALKPFCDDLVA